jgi:hypothetical protein
MSWVGSPDEIRRLINENRVLRAQVKLASTDLRRLVREQEELLAKSVKLATWPGGSGDSSFAGFEPQVRAQRKRGLVFGQTSEWTEARRPEVHALSEGANDKVCV